MAVTTIRLEDGELREIKDVARALGVDQSTVMRRALKKGVDGLRIESALEKYSTRKVSFPEAARLAGISEWRLIDEMKARHVFFHVDEESVEESLKEFK